MIDQAQAFIIYVLTVYGAWKILELIIENFPFFNTCNYLISYYYTRPNGTSGFGHMNIEHKGKIKESKDVNDISEHIEKVNNHEVVIIINFTRLKRC